MFVPAPRLSAETDEDRRVLARPSGVKPLWSKPTFYDREHNEQFYDDMEDLLCKISRAGEDPFKGVRRLAEITARYPEINIWYHQEEGWVVDVDGPPGSQGGKRCTLRTVATDRPRVVEFQEYCTFDAVLTVMLTPAHGEKLGVYSGFSVDVDFWLKHVKVHGVEEHIGEDMCTVKARFNYDKKFDMETGQPAYTSTCDLEFASEATKQTRESFNEENLNAFFQTEIRHVMGVFGFNKDEISERPYAVTVSAAPETAAKRRPATR